MSGRIRSCTGHERTPLADGWEIAAAPPLGNAVSSASAPPGVNWSPGRVPGTAASSLRESGLWSTEGAARKFDAEDWWYRIRFSASPATADERVLLCFDGLATLAEVWLNGSLLLASANMFVEHRCDVGSALLRENELVIRFAAIDAHLAVRRRRPRWRVPMVLQQQLRWVRTTLLGRTPGWSPPAAAVGPWRAVWLERQRLSACTDLRLLAAVQQTQGRLAMSCALTMFGGAKLHSAQLIAERNGRSHATGIEVLRAARRLDAVLHLPNVDLWWPHTHGEPALYRVRLRLTLHDPEHAEEREVNLDLGSVGFRDVRLVRDSGDFALSVNGRPVFCRGASWTPLDVVSLQSSEEEYREAFACIRESGMNMLRVAGPMVYESDRFLELCDSNGILLWQDFMFANMDYPADDAAFAASVRLEAGQQLLRLQAHPALAVLCGNSEGAQQAAMSGAGRDQWSPQLFEADLAGLSQVYCPGVPYCPSSTHGGAFPHQADTGATSYYGVGAYLLPLNDARRCELRFASECLAFANVPENETLELLARGAALGSHHPRWKERVPRDLGAGWDFDDVRDHYMTQLYRLEALPLRYADPDRYLRLARASSGEVMAAAFAEWRRVKSGCRGALLWFLRDLWPGAGWGVIDSTGLPKAAYYYLKRALQPLGLFVTDEGTNGLLIHVANDGACAVRARLELRLYRYSEPVGTVLSQVRTVDADSNTKVPATDLFEGFTDLSYAYRFGPPACDLLHASLKREPDDELLAEAFHFPCGLPNTREADVGLCATAKLRDDGAVQVAIQSRRFAQSVHLEMPGFIADDQYFHMRPQSARVITLKPRRAGAAASPEGTLHALNAAATCRIAIAR